MPCNPGSGFPVPKPRCPDASPETGWLTVNDDGLTLSPFRTLRNDVEGAAYAAEQDEDYPFPNDYFDAPVGARHSVELAPRTVCTGIIRVGYQAPLQDHIVSCDALQRVAQRRELPVAVWVAEGDAIQVSELYRP